MKREQTHFKILTLLYLIAAAVAGYLVYDHYVLLNGENFTSMCTVNSYFDCDAVNSSRFSVFLGVPVASWGLGYYLAAAVVSIFAVASAYAVREAALLLLPGAAISLLASIILFVISVTTINAICLFCTALYVLNILTAGILLSVARGWLTTIPAEVAKVDRNRFTLFAATMAVVLAMTAIITAQLKQTAPFNAQAFEMQITNATPVTLDTAGAPQLGATNAVVRLVEFSDFECPFCGRQARELKRILRNYGDKVQLTFMNYPLDNSCNPDMQGRPLHRTACMAARAAWCATQKGQFEGMAALMFANQKAISPENIGLWAQDLGLSAPVFNECVASDVARDAVASDIRRAQALHISSTPTFYINGRQFSGLITTDTIEWLLAHPESIK